MLNKLTDLYHSNLFQNKIALKYLWNRGLFTKTLKHFKVGYCDNNIGYEFVSSRYNPSIIEKSGLFKNNQDIFNSRIIFPLIKDNNTYYFTSRSIIDCKKPHIHQKGKIPILFNHDALKKNTIIIVEASICAMTLHQYNFDSVATLGTIGHIKDHLNKLQDKIIYISYDKDPNESGQKGAIRMSRILSKMGINAYIINFPSSQNKVDVNSFFKTHNKKDFQRLMDNSILYSKTDDYLKQKQNIPQSYSNDTFPIQIIAEDYGLELHLVSHGFNCICNFHPDTSPSLNLYTKSNSFYCFGCHKGGDSVEFLRLLEIEKTGRFMTRKEAAKILCEKY
jgi:DNA primase